MLICALGGILKQCISLHISLYTHTHAGMSKPGEEVRVCPRSGHLHKYERDRLRPCSREGAQHTLTVTNLAALVTCFGLVFLSPGRLGRTFPASPQCEVTDRRESHSCLMQELNRPAVIQFSEGGSAFIAPRIRRVTSGRSIPSCQHLPTQAGKSLPNEQGVNQVAFWILCLVRSLAS